MAKPQIQLAPADTAPRTRVRLRMPKKADGSIGDPMDLFGCTVVFWYQVRSGSSAAVTRAAIPVQSAPSPSPDGNDGICDIDWLASGGAPATGNQDPIDYNARYIVTDGTGHQETWPNGPDDPKPDGTNPAFLWMQVSRDFRAVGPDQRTRWNACAIFGP